MTLSLFDKRAVLFLPGNNLRAIARARESAADLVILDLEDAVKAEDKVEARKAATAAVSKTWVMPVGIRVNAGDEADLAAVLDSGCDFVIVPMVEAPLGIVGKPVLAMIETPRGVIAANDIAASVAGLIVGTNDLSAGLKLPANDRKSLQYALQKTVLAARAAGIAVFDGVFNRLDDPAGLAAECAESRALGFDGKSLIHPDQIAPCHAAFAPTPAELARAERLVAAATGGAERFEGAMIEAMHVAAARKLLDRP
jgi:citrate lyase subunit beta/citryl-CoA lyase